MDKVETLQELVEQRREIQRLKKKQRRRKLWKKLNHAVTAALLVFLAILFTRVTPVDPGIVMNGSSYEVQVSEDQVQTFD